MNELWHDAALFNNLFEEEVRVRDEFVDRFLISENAILVRLTMLEHAQIWLTGHKQALLDDVNEAEAEEIQRDVHKVRRG